MEGATESRNGKILLSIIENTPYTDQPQSRIEELLIELKEIIEAGGGGGTTSYEGLTGKPKINGYTLLGDVSLSDIGAASEDDLSEKQDTISDLSTIRSGAAAGATAVQPADMNTALAAKQDTLTFDSTPTQDSTNPVTSGGIWTDQQRQDALQTEDRSALVELVDGGAKNRWKITIPSTLPTGFTATVDTDGALILNGTTGSSALTFETSTQFHAGETVVLSGCPSGGSDDSYRLDILRGANTNYCYGDPVIASSFTETAYPVRIRIAANYTCNNLKFYPMVCTLAAWKISQTFQPYRPSWQEMYEMILQLQTAAGLKSTLSLRSAAAPLENEDDLQKDEIQIETEVKE